MCDQVVTVIAEQSDRLQHELAPLWAAADLAALTRTLAIAQPHARDQAQLLERIDELDERIGDALVQVEDSAGALSDAVAAIRSLALVPDRGAAHRTRRVWFTRGRHAPAAHRRRGPGGRAG